MEKSFLWSKMLCIISKSTLFCIRKWVLSKERHNNYMLMWFLVVWNCHALLLALSKIQYMVGKIPHFAPGNRPFLFGIDWLESFRKLIWHAVYRCSGILTRCQHNWLKCEKYFMLNEMEPLQNVWGLSNTVRCKLVRYWQTNPLIFWANYGLLIQVIDPWACV